MKSIFYFVYCRKTRNQISRATRSYKRTKRTREELNVGSNKQYAIGSLIFTEDRGIVRIGRGKINLSEELLPARIKFARR